MGPDVLAAGAIHDADVGARVAHQRVEGVLTAFDPADDVSAGPLALGVSEVRDALVGVVAGVLRDAGDLNVGRGSLPSLRATTIRGSDDVNDRARPLRREMWTESTKDVSRTTQASGLKTPRNCEDVTFRRKDVSAYLRLGVATISCSQATVHHLQIQSISSPGGSPPRRSYRGRASSLL